MEDNIWTIYENKKGIWKGQFNKEPQEEMGMASVISFIKEQRLQGWDT